MNKETIKELALANGFKLKEQPDGTMDLNPYVFEFAAAIDRVAASELDQLKKKLFVLITDIEWHHSKTAFIPTSLALKAKGMKEELQNKEMIG